MSSPASLEFDPQCRRCARLNRYLIDVKKRYPGYHAAPVAPFGVVRPRLLIVGLAPGLHGANRTGRPFTGDHAGLLLYETLHRYDLANRPESLAAADGLRLRHCRITNAVKCVPPENKPSGDEVATCNRYLRHEIDSLRPKAVVLALGGVAHRAVLKALSLPMSRFPFAHGSEYRLPNDLTLISSYHCSRYNTQTKRLTSAMFRRVVARAKSLFPR